MDGLCGLLGSIFCHIAKDVIHMALEIHYREKIYYNPTGNLVGVYFFVEKEWWVANRMLINVKEKICPKVKMTFTNLAWKTEEGWFNHGLCEDYKDEYMGYQDQWKYETWWTAIIHLKNNKILYIIGKGKKHKWEKKIFHTPVSTRVGKWRIL
jgi:hypothetical protein